MLAERHNHGAIALIYYEGERGPGVGMSYQLGVDLGTTYTAVAVRRDDETRIVHLGTRSAAIPSVVLLKEDETILVGEAAQRRGVSEPRRVARQFKRRIGDTTPLILGSTPYSAEALMARLLRWVVEEVTKREGGPPTSIVVTHPANWAEYKKGLLNQAIRIADIDNAVLITEPEAAALHYASQERIDTGRVIAVYDLGGGTFDAAVLRKTTDGFTYLGSPEGIDRLGGIDFDEAVFNHTLRALEASGAEIDAADEQTVAALRRLRDECTQAKEALSADSDVSIPVLLPSIQTDVRLTRVELEAMIRPSLADTIGAMQRAVRSSGLEMSEIDAILLVGGSSRIPLVSELVASQLARPVVVDAHPKHAIALGAALWDRAIAAPSAPAADAAIPATPLPDGHYASESTPGTAPDLAMEPAPAVADTDVVPAQTVGTPVVEPAAGFAAQPVAPQPVAPQHDLAPEQPVVTASVPAAAGGSGPPPATPLATSQLAPINGAESQGLSKRMLIAGGIIAVLVAIAVILLVTQAGRGETQVAVGDGSENGSPDAQADGDAVQPVVPVAATATVTPEPTPPRPTATALPEATATPQPTPTTVPTPLPFPLETRRVDLTRIVLSGSAYVVTYDTINFEPVLGGSGTHHLHFHWNIYPPASVGTTSNPQNPWVVWDTQDDGTKVFNQFTTGLVPSGASAICAVVATDAHAVDEPELAADTVSCIDLP